MAAAGSSRAAALALLAAGCTSIAADSRAFEGTHWHVTAISGQATPQAGNYRIGFANGRIGGQFGCNHFGGHYSVSSETLIARDVASTLMGCAEPAASFETRGFAVLNRPMRMSWQSGTRLTLANSAGSIALERVP